MIKLQLILRNPAAGTAPHLLELLRAHGIEVTASGRASLSAHVAPDDFRRLFGEIPPMKSGFSTDALTAPDLPVPAALADAISLITVVPHHTPMNRI